MDESIGDGLTGFMVAKDESADAGPVQGGHGGSGGVGKRFWGGVDEHGFAGEAFGLQGTELLEGLVEGAFEAALVEFEALESSSVGGTEGIQEGMEGGGAAEVPGGQEELGEDFRFEGASGGELGFEVRA